MKHHVAFWPKKAPRQRFGTTILRGPPQRLHGVCLHLGPKYVCHDAATPWTNRIGTLGELRGKCVVSVENIQKHVEHVWFPARQKCIHARFSHIWTLTDWTIRFSADEKRNGLEDDGPMYGNWGLAIGCTNGQNKMPEEVPPSELGNVSAMLLGTIIDCTHPCILR